MSSAVVGITWGPSASGNCLLPLQLSWWEERASGLSELRGFQEKARSSFTPRSSEQVVLSSAGDRGLDCNRSPRVLSWGPGGWLALGSRAGQPQERLLAGGRLRVQSPGPLVKMELGIRAH